MRRWRETVRFSFLRLVRRDSRRLELSEWELSKEGISLEVRLGNRILRREKQGVNGSGGPLERVSGARKGPSRGQRHLMTIDSLSFKLSNAFEP